jgi:hypothetical protein
MRWSPRRSAARAVACAALLALASCGRAEQSSVAVGSRGSTAAPTTAAPTTAVPTTAVPPTAAGRTSTSKGPGSTTAPSLPEAPNGYRWETSKSGDVSLLIPKSWSSIDLSKDDIEEMINTVEKVNAELAAQMRTNKAAFRQIALYAIGPPKDGFAPNVNGLEIPSRLPVESVMEGAKEQLSAFGTIIDTSTRRIAGEDAAVLRYTLDANGVSITGQQIYVPYSDGTLALTISGDVPSDVIDTMLNSITFAPE